MELALIIQTALAIIAGGGIGYWIHASDPKYMLGATGYTKTEVEAATLARAHVTDLMYQPEKVTPDQIHAHIELIRHIETSQHVQRGISIILTKIFLIDTERATQAGTPNFPAPRNKAYLEAIHEILDKYITNPSRGKYRLSPLTEARLNNKTTQNVPSAIIESVNLITGIGKEILNQAPINNPKKGN